MKTELQYKRIPGFSKYSIREDGKEVLSHIKYPEGRPLKIINIGKNNAFVTLKSKCNKLIKYIYYLVAEIFISNHNNHPLVTHIEDDTDHNYKNLKWYSGSDEHEIMIWKEIPIYPGYIISEYGHIISLKYKTPKILTVKERKDKIKYIKFAHGLVMIHHLVALTFLPNPDNYEHLFHIENVENNHYTNLKWSKNLKNFPDMEWKIIKDFPRYKISEYGHVMSYCYIIPTLMIPENRYDYKNITLINENTQKYFPIEKLVADAFIPNPDNYEYIIHLDKNTENNHYINLMWSPTEDLENDDIVWKEIENYPGYKISDTGFVKSYKNKERKYVNHRDENKLNPHYTNLEWVTQKENMIHSANMKRYKKVINELKEKFI